MKFLLQRSVLVFIAFWNHTTYILCMIICNFPTKHISSYKYKIYMGSPWQTVNPNQKFIVVATLRMVGNRWLWSIMLGTANEARKSWVGYRRLPTEFLILETQLQATMIIVGISKCTQHMFVKLSGRNSSHLRHYSQLLADYHWHFHA